MHQVVVTEDASGRGGEGGRERAIDMKRSADGRVICEAAWLYVPRVFVPRLDKSEMAIAYAQNAAWSKVLRPGGWRDR